MEDFSKVIDFIKRKILSCGFSVHDIQIKDSGKRLIIRVFIDRNDRFVSIDDCVFVSRNLEPHLESMIHKSFVLEVSSPGADREIKTDEDFQRFKGMKVEITKKDGRKIIGKLMGKVNDEVFLMDEGSKVSGKISGFLLTDIRKIKLCPW